MNPFDIRSALLAKHAQHVVLIHFPIALFLAGAGFDIVGRWTRHAGRKARLASCARLNLLAAAMSVWPTLATGILAWRWQLAGKKLKGMLLLHFVLACAAAILISFVAWIHLRRRKSSSSRCPAYCLLLELLTAALLIVAAHAGGFLSGVNLAGPLSRDWTRTPRLPIPYTIQSPS
jgi:uncharacterized membrane protein